MALDFVRWLTWLSAAAVLAPAAIRADDWPQWGGPKRDGVWRETGIIRRIPKEGLPVVWRQKVAEGYAGPAVANGKVYVTDWVRDPQARRPGSAFNNSVQLPGQERVLCLDEQSGKVLWTHSYNCPYKVSYSAGPRCTPLADGNRVYTLGAMGHLFCLDAATGKPVWSKEFAKDFGARVPLWGFAGHPLLERGKLICTVGGEGECLVVAFDAASGNEVWRALPTLDAVHGPGYAPPVIAEVGKTRQVIIWHPNGVSSLDPESGKVHWTQEFVLKAGMSIATPRVVGDRLFVTSFYSGPMMLQLSSEAPAARVLWRAREGVTEHKTDGLHAVMCTPAIKDGYIYGVCSYGQLRCLRVSSGERVWEDLKAAAGKQERWGNAFIIPNGDREFLFNERGELILADLNPDGYEEIGRTRILEPTNPLVNRPVVWMHPAFANKRMYARNDKEIVCVSLAAQ
jgi:outer membrane protein assembly factor BamB